MRHVVVPFELVAINNETLEQDVGFGKGTNHKRTYTVGGYAVAQLVEALRYKPEGRGFDSRWCH